MSRPVFAIFVLSIVAIAFLAMWLGWRARSRRDASVRTAQVAPVGALIAEFTRVLYVSTTPVGEPLVRVAVPGLRYRGQAEIAVRDDGATVTVVGEDPVHFSASQLRGSAAAGRRVGKAVEQDGLALMRWVAASRTEPVAASRTESVAASHPEPVEGSEAGGSDPSTSSGADRASRPDTQPGTHPGTLESSFRFESKAEQRRFAAAIDQISLSTPTSQEGAQ